MKDSPSIFGKAYRKAVRDWQSARQRFFKGRYGFLHDRWHSESNPSRPPKKSVENVLALSAPVEVLRPETVCKREAPLFSPDVEMYRVSGPHEYEFVAGATYVAQLEGGRVFAPSTVLTNGHTLLQKESFEFNVRGDEDRAIFHRFSLPRLEKMSGTVALVASDDIQNYHHWLFYTLPRIGMVLESSFTVDKYLINRVDRAFQKETLHRLGIPMERLIFSEDHPYLEAERLLVTPAPVPTRHSPFAVEFVRKTFGASCPDPKRMVYLGRGAVSTRKCLNEDEVVDALGAWGFEFVSMDGRSVAEQAQLMAESKVVVAPHGAAMTNIAFMNPESTVLEFAHEHLNIRFFWDLASRVGLRYSFIPTELFPSDNKKVLPFMYDFKVDIEQLKQRVSQLLGEDIGKDRL